MVHENGLYHQCLWRFQRMWRLHQPVDGLAKPAFERAASYFLGHFQGLGYEASLMRVSDTLSFTQPESLNVIAWKRGYDDTCVQGIGAHMDIASCWPSCGGTYEGAYDNTAGTVAVMLYAKAFTEIEVRCDTFLALWSERRRRLTRLKCLC